MNRAAMCVYHAEIPRNIPFSALALRLVTMLFNYEHEMPIHI